MNGLELLRERQKLIALRQSLPGIRVDAPPRIRDSLTKICSEEFERLNVEITAVEARLEALREE